MHAVKPNRESDENKQLQKYRLIELDAENIHTARKKENKIHKRKKSELFRMHTAPRIFLFFFLLLHRHTARETEISPISCVREYVAGAAAAAAIFPLLFWLSLFRAEKMGPETITKI